jgi:parallel beta-helix repeat protein
MIWFRPRKRRHSSRTGFSGAAYRRLLSLEPLEDRLAPAVFTVTNAGDTGAGVGLAGDLRYCITQANATPGTDTIQFAIPGAGLHTINLTSALPAITDPVVIDGYTQAGTSLNTLATGDNAVLAIELNGSAAGTGVNGLTSNAGGCTIRGLVIDGFGANGIGISGASASGNIIEGNFIGTDATGTTASGNAGDGVAISNGPNNTIGGITADARNVISGNTGDGVDITGAAGNVVEGNFIGTDATGTAKLGNTSLGVYIGASNNTVGGTAAGAGNIISANHLGVRIDGVDNQVLSNFIGTDVTGSHSLGNQFEGVIFLNGSNNTVGGTTAAARNVISGNGEVGLWISVNCNSDVVQGNYIGTDATGTVALPNAIDGVRIIGDANNTIGGTTTGAGNLISGNGNDGVLISDSGATGNLVAGNYIGTDASGTVSLANSTTGVLIQNGAVSNTIGGTTAAARNVISGNTGDGVELSAPSNTVEGDYIGTDVTGNGGLGNGSRGVIIQSDGETIGGTAAGAGNVISANIQEGIEFYNATSGIANPVGSLVADNTIGLGADGTTSLGNQQYGIYVALDTRFVTIGGTTAAARNVISSNNNSGIISDAGADHLTIQGNYIGTDASGELPRGNLYIGIEVLSPNAVIGGLTATPGAGPGNVIAANGSGPSTGNGIDLLGSANNAVVQGNIVGLDAAGTTIPNNYQATGIGASGLTNLTIGGAVSGAGNIVSGNGVGIQFSSVSGSLVAGNYVGPDISGTVARGNAFIGVEVESGSSNNTIGGTTAEARNVISGNMGEGILFDYGADNNRVQGNFIGVDKTGNVALGNALGVETSYYSENNIIGVDATNNPAERNVISGNYDGVVITQWNNNVVAGNLIGLGVDGSTIVPNTNVGVGVYAGASGTTIGGTTVAARNTISGNGEAGVLVGNGDGTAGNVIEGNYIGTDATGLLARPDGPGSCCSHAAGVWFLGAGANTLGGTAAGVANVISGNGTGVYLSDATTGVVIEGNLIGTDATGTTTLGNQSEGVLIGGASGQFGSSTGGSHDNTIGGTTAAARNIISGNGGDGIHITDSGTTGNVIEGNYIGPDVSGSNSLGNSYGVDVEAAGNTIGGTVDGAGNVVSGNKGPSGVHINGDNNLIAGNLIGLDATGTAALGNYYYGLTVGGTGNTIGGVETAARNVISGNINNGGGQGIELVLAGTNTLVEGNYIGTDITGNAAVANSYNVAVAVNGGSGNTIGGVTSAARNVISGHYGNYGIAVEFGATGTLIEGNYVGVNAAGTAALANGAGIAIYGASNNTIGGTTPGAGNVISGNTLWGIHLGVSSAVNPTTNNIVAGNFIGTDPTGTQYMLNGYGGLLIDGGAFGNTIGGISAGARNIISGNDLYDSGIGIEISDATTAGNQVEGNYIGTDVTGTVALVNAIGVFIEGAPNNTIGGTVDGAGNLISGNRHDGVLIDGATATGNLVAGNNIGTDVTGAAALPNGTAAPIFAGVHITNASGNTIGGTIQIACNIISGNVGDGVDISGSGSSGNVVEGNYIGTDVTGTNALANLNGVGIVDAVGNTVGGTVDGARNVISGNTDLAGNSSGLYIQGSATGNVVEGNYVGLNAAGNGALPNDFGVYSLGSAQGNTIGGTSSAARNVVSGNNGYGLILLGSGATGNVAEGNYFGTDSTGDAALSNGKAQILIEDASNNNLIGGSAAGAGNLISGGSGRNADGIWMVNGASNNTVQGNLIGTTADGTAALGNAAGVAIDAGSTNNTVGGSAAGASNVISGNSIVGVEILAAGSNGNVVQGNFIGTNAAGAAALANLGDGVLISTGAASNTIGGTTPAARNVISGNQTAGVHITDAGTTGNVVEGNYIGTDVTGSAALGNTGSGVRVELQATGNFIGGAVAGTGNVISGNSGSGVQLLGAGTTANVVAGNFLGVNAAGAVALPNLNGVEITDASGNTIGGTVAGSRNVISGNTNALGDSSGITFLGAASDNLVQGNYIGLNAAGSAALANIYGITFGGTAHNNTIGGTTAAASNVISGNRGYGVVMRASRNIVQGNYLGTDSTGDAAISNGTAQILINGSNNNLIGGTAAGAGNLISGGGSRNADGIWMVNGASNNTVQGNLIGTTADGTAALGNAAGVAIDAGSTNNTVGGSAVGAGNVISGNSIVGVEILAAGSNGNVVQGNFIGTNAAGAAALANLGDGVLISAGAASNTIGGTTPAARNVISGNLTAGVHITDAGTTGNVVEGNYIGADASGNNALGNGSSGVFVASSGNTVGGVSQGAGNVISGNASDGVDLNSPATDDVVVGNFIGTNAAGTARLGNQVDGVDIFSGGNHIIGGTSTGARNIISGNTRAGVILFGGSNTVLEGNYIGTDVTGSVGISNVSFGVLLSDASFTQIGGTTPGAGNVISDSAGPGIEIAGGTSTNITIQGNLIGTDATGTKALGNSGEGIFLAGGGGNSSALTLIGGTDPGARNVISANGVGIELGGSADTANQIEGNFIGTDITGSHALGNLGDGVLLVLGANDNTIGGTTAGAGNVISGNIGDGVHLTDAGTTGNLVQGNYIGTDVTGTAALGNTGSGVHVEQQASGNIIGGAAPGAGNLISGNGLPPGIVSWYRADGNANDSLSGNNGNAASGLTFVPGVYGQAFSFNGTDASISVPASQTLDVGQASGLTIEAWINPANTSHRSPLVEWSNGAHLWIGAGFPTTSVPGDVFANLVDTTGAYHAFNTAGGVLTAGVFQHVALTYDKGTGIASIYVNGVLEAQQNLGIFTPRTNTNLTFGLRPPDSFPGTGNDNGARYTGAMDDLAIYHRALSAAEINVIYTAGGGKKLASGNANGVELDSNAAGNLVQGNFIGTDVTGAAALGNSLYGIALNSASVNSIIGNTISGNASDGVNVSGDGALPGTVSWYRAEGNANDALGNNNGTVHDATFATGIHGQGFSFDGVDDYIDLGKNPSLDLPGSETWSGWFNIQSLPRYKYLIADFAATNGNGSEGSLGVEPAGNGNRFYWFQSYTDGTNSTALLGSTAVNLNQWYHVAVVRDDVAKTVTIYLNGAVDGVFSYAGETVVGLTNDKLLGGSGPAFPGDFFNGLMDEVSLFNRPLSAAEIQTIYQEQGAGLGGATIQGNLIGTNAAGTAALANGGNGVTITNAADNTIGGTTAAARNIISGNSGYGIVLTNAGTSNTAIEGNYIGLQANGSTGLANLGGGLLLTNGASSNTIGGTMAGAGNVFGGVVNGDVAITMGGVGTQFNVVEGNFIGTDATGLHYSSGFNYGFLLGGAAFYNTIGGTAPGARNVIDGMASDAMIIAASNNTVEGNYVGLNATGSQAIGNANGIDVTGFNDTISGNVISGNLHSAIYLYESANSLVQGNLIGTNAAGTTGVGNGGGIVVWSARDCTIGGTTAAERNVISGNNGPGILISTVIPGVVSSGNTVRGNYIGTDASGALPLGNTSDGIRLEAGAINNTIGGTAAGSGNVISGNGGDGILITGSGTAANIVEGNHIGTDATGETAIPNSTQTSALGAGVFVLGSPDNQIGGTAPGAGNLISGNANYGVFIDGITATGNRIQGNLIGTDAAGTQNLGNAFNGVLLINGASGNLIGGTTDGTRNVISGNGAPGVAIAGYDDDQGLVHMITANNTVAGNFIGTDVTGTHAIGNSEGGVFVDDADNNVIGGTTPDAGNVISGNNGFAGVFIAQSFPGSGGTGNLVEGNLIGTDVNGAALGNRSPGVVVEGGRNNVIGGTAVGAGNVIAFNTKGVVIRNSPYAFATGPTSGNSILGNEIYDNAGLGIDLGDSGSFLTNDSQGHNGPNDFEDFPVLTQLSNSSDSNTVSVSLNSTPDTTYRIEFFANDPPDPSSVDPGQVYLGFVNATTDASGQASFDYSYTADPRLPFLTATATDSFGNTSEFSDFPLLPPPPPPPPPIVEITPPAPIVDNAPLAVAVVAVAAAPAALETPPAAPVVASAATVTVATELTAAVTVAPVASVSSSSGGEAVSTRPAPTPTRVTDAPITLGISFDGSDRATAPTMPGQTSVSAPLTVYQAVEASLRPTGPQGGGRGGDHTAPRPEDQLFLQTTSLVAATLDGDDSVDLVETLLRGKVSGPPKNEQRSEIEKPVQREVPTAVAEVSGRATAPAEASDQGTETRTGLTALLKRLAIPVALVLTAAGWLWYRSRSGRNAKPTPDA